MKRTSALRALAATALAGAALSLPTTAGAGSAHGTGIGLPDSAAVGQTIDASIVITNASTPPESGSTHTISDITLIPACGALTLNSAGQCGAPDAGVLVPGPTALGHEGTGCADLHFTVVPTARPNEYRLTPESPLVLAAPTGGVADECTIDLQLSVQRLPTLDVAPATGTQTAAFVTSVGTSNLFPTPSANTTSFASGAQPITIERAAPTISTSVVEPEVELGEPVADQATIAGGADPTGTVTFDLYGPDDADCSEAPVASSTHPVDGAGSYASSATTPTEPGEYRYVATYSGDAANHPASGACGDLRESAVVAAAEPPGIRVLKVATPMSRPEPGGTFSFQLAITNTSAVPLTITELVDDVYGDVATQGTCAQAVGTTLGPGDSTTCAFPGQLTGNAGATQTDVVTVTAVDGAGAPVTDTDDAVVSLTDVRPTATVEKTALPEARVAPGGLFTFGVKITNTSFEPVTVTELEDDVYGDLAERTSTTCAQLVGKVVAPAATVSCTFEGQLTGAAGATQTDVVTVTVTDDDGSTGTARDDATIRLVRPGELPTTTTTTAPAGSSTTSTTPTTGPAGPTTTTAAPGAPPTTRAPSGPGQPRLAFTGSDPRSSGLLAGSLLGLGLLLTGLSMRSPRPRRSAR